MKSDLTGGWPKVLDGRSKKIPERSANGHSGSESWKRLQHDAGPGAEWAFLPEGLRGLREGHDSPESFWREINELASLARERKTIAGSNPETLVSEEDWQNFWRRAGKPDKAEGYVLPEQWSDNGIEPVIVAEVNKTLGSDRQAFMEACHACDLTARQAKALFGIVGGLMAETMTRERSGVASSEQVMAELWPQETHKHLDAARRGAHYAGLGDDLDAAGLSFNPLVLRLAKALGELLGESSAPGHNGFVAALPRGDMAREEMYRLIASDAYRNNESDAIRKVEALSRRI